MCNVSILGARRNVRGGGGKSRTALPPPPFKDNEMPAIRK